MPDLNDLQPLAQQNLPAITFPGSNLTEQMLNGFVAAKTQIRKLVPAGYTLNYDTALLTAESLASQVGQRKGAVQTAFQNAQDLSQQDALTTDHQGSREYWISQYAIASEGIGAYASGDMQRLVGTRSGWTQIDYDESVQHRTNIYASIVDAADKGYLSALLAPEAYAQSTIMNSPQGAMMVRSGQVPQTGAGSVITVASPGMTVRVPKVATAVGASGLGLAPVVVGAIWVAVAAVAIVAGVTVYYIQKKKMEISAALAAQVCRDAFASGNAAAIQTCKDMTSEITKPQSAADTLIGGKIQDYLIWGGVALAGIYFAPLIVQSLVGVQGALIKRNRRR